jgi:hypothetical protein
VALNRRKGRPLKGFENILKYTGKHTGTITIIASAYRLRRPGLEKFNTTFPPLWLKRSPSPSLHSPKESMGSLVNCARLYSIKTLCPPFSDSSQRGCSSLRSCIYYCNESRCSFQNSNHVKGYGKTFWEQSRMYSVAIDCRVTRE